LSETEKENDFDVRKSFAIKSSSPFKVTGNLVTFLVNSSSYDEAEVKLGATTLITTFVLSDGGGDTVTLIVKPLSSPSINDDAPMGPSILIVGLIISAAAPGLIKTN